MNDVGRTPVDAFERIYRDVNDPWEYETSDYERAKYERTLAALGDRDYSSALEVGCSIGVFTPELARRCDRVVALDPSPSALARARERLSDQPHVEFEQAAVPEGLPPGPHDLVICSEVLYYLSEPLVLETLTEIDDASSLEARSWRFTGAANPGAAGSISQSRHCAAGAASLALRTGRRICKSNRS